MKQKSDGKAPVIMELWGNVEYPFLAISSRFTLVWSGIVLPMGQIELFDIQTERKQMTYAKLNCLQ